MDLEERKREEQEFHNRYRAVYEQGGAEYARFTANKKYYSVDRASRDFVRDWLARETPRKRVLEYGCGGGSYSFYVAQMASHVHGIDISDESIELCKQRALDHGVAGKTTFRVMDCENLDFADNSFDVICEAGVLHHLDLERVLPEVSRVLSPGGKMICTEALVHNPFFQAYRRLTPHLRTEWETNHILSVDQILSAKRYFRKVDVHYFHLASLAAVPFRRFPKVFDRLLSGLERVDNALLSVPAIGRFAWMAVCVWSDPIKPGRS